MTSKEVGTFFFLLDCHINFLIYYELIQDTSKRVCDFDVYASVLSRGLICVRLRFCLLTTLGGKISHVFATSPLVIEPASSVPQLHWWYSQPGLCNSSTADRASKFCATFLLHLFYLGDLDLIKRLFKCKMLSIVAVWLVSVWSILSVGITPWFYFHSSVICRM